MIKTRRGKGLVTMAAVLLLIGVVAGESGTREDLNATLLERYDRGSLPQPETIVGWWLGTCWNPDDPSVATPQVLVAYQTWESKAARRGVRSRVSRHRQWHRVFCYYVRELSEVPIMDLLPEERHAIVSEIRRGGRCIARAEEEDGSWVVRSMAQKHSQDPDSRIWRLRSSSGGELILLCSRVSKGQESTEMQKASVCRFRRLGTQAAWFQEAAGAYATSDK